MIIALDEFLPQARTHILLQLCSWPQKLFDDNHLGKKLVGATAATTTTDIN